MKKQQAYRVSYKRRKVNFTTIIFALPFLELVALQQGLRLNRKREFEICKEVLNKSINDN